MLSRSLRSNLGRLFVISLTATVPHASQAQEKAGNAGSGRLQITLDEQGDCSLLVDTRQEGREKKEPQGEVMALSGVPGATVRRLESGTHRITYSFADLTTPAAFSKLNGTSPLPMQGVSIDKTAGTLVMTPITAEKSAGKKSSFAFPRTVKPAISIEVDFEKFTAGTFVVQLSSLTPTGILAINLSPIARKGIKAEASWIPIDGGKRGKGVNLLEREGEPGKVSEYGFHVPIKSEKLDDRFFVEFGLHGQMPVAIKRIGVEGKLVASFGMSLGVARDGVLVKQSFKGGSADKAGLKDGDVIIAFNGERMTKFQDLLAKLAEAEIGKEIKIVAKRGAMEKSFIVKGE